MSALSAVLAVAVVWALVAYLVPDRHQMIRPRRRGRDRTDTEESP